MYTVFTLASHYNNVHDIVAPTTAAAPTTTAAQATTVGFFSG